MQQQMTDLRKRVNLRQQWVQLGVAAAGVIAPLIARWTDLRATERARALAEEAQARLKSTRELAPRARADAQRQLSGMLRAGPLAARKKGSARLWLIGAGVGLVAAGAGAYVLVRRRMAAASEEPLVELPITVANGKAGYANGTVSTAQRRAQTSATASAAHSATSAATPTRPVVVEPTVQTGGGATLTPEGAPAGVVKPEEAPFIGNIRTMIYHEANAENLPAEENRIYFASEQEAIDADYRRDRDEVPRSDTSAARTEEHAE